VFFALGFTRAGANINAMRMNLKGLFLIAASLGLGMGGPDHALANDWIRFSGGANAEFSWYFDRKPMRDYGEWKAVWLLKDMAAADPETGRHSFKVLLILDCPNKKHRYVSVAGYSDPMAQGDPAGTDNKLGPWISHSNKDALFHHLNRLVCKQAGSQASR
jgi:hypothetical protein